MSSPQNTQQLSIETIDRSAPKGSTIFFLLVVGWVTAYPLQYTMNYFFFGSPKIQEPVVDPNWKAKVVLLEGKSVDAPILFDAAALDDGEYEVIAYPHTGEVIKRYVTVAQNSKGFITPSPKPPIPSPPIPPPVPPDVKPPEKALTIVEQRAYTAMKMYVQKVGKNWLESSGDPETDVVKRLLKFSQRDTLARQEHEKELQSILKDTWGDSPTVAVELAKKTMTELSSGSLAVLKERENVKP